MSHLLQDLYRKTRINPLGQLTQLPLSKVDPLGQVKHNFYHLFLHADPDNCQFGQFGSDSVVSPVYRSFVFSTYSINRTCFIRYTTAIVSSTIYSWQVLVLFCSHFISWSSPLGVHFSHFPASRESNRHFPSYLTWFGFNFSARTTTYRIIMFISALSLQSLVHSTLVEVCSPSQAVVHSSKVSIQDDYTFRHQ